MYQRNLLQRNVLITPAEVTAKTDSSNTIDQRKFLMAIEVAEERFVREALGSDYYDYLIDAKNVEVTNSNKATLQNQVNAAYGLASTTAASELKVGDIVNAVEFLPEADQKLWKMYLWKITAECVHFTAIPANYAEFSSQGIMKNNPETSLIGDKGSASVGISLADAKWLMDKWLEGNINPMILAMHNWLCKNIGSYPKYRGKCDCNSENGDVTGVGGWITSIYDDDESERGCQC